MGLPDGVMLPPTLGGGVLSILDGGVLPTLGAPVYSPSCGVFVRMFRNCWMMAMCLALASAAGGVTLFNCIINSVAVLAVLSSLEMVGIFQWVG